jgi:hypothetical protein
MAYEQKEGQGSLWINDRKEKDTHPDLTGTILIGGKEHWISAWARKHDTKGKWLSVSVKVKEPKPAAPVVSGDGKDDSLPF